MTAFIMLTQTDGRPICVSASSIHAFWPLTNTDGGRKNSMIEYGSVDRELKTGTVYVKETFSEIVDKIAAVNAAETVSREKEVDEKAKAEAEAAKRLQERVEAEEAKRLAEFYKARKDLMDATMDAIAANA